MKITKTSTVTDIQEQFHAKFPLLTIRFYKVAHEDHEGSRKKDEVEDNLALSELSPSLQEASIPLTPQLTVEALESMFENEFGLHIQVFRKSGDTWLQTSVTDHWTLEKHMKVAEDMDKFQSTPH
jgi:hypothetical protein